MIREMIGSLFIGGMLVGALETIVFTGIVWLIAEIVRLEKAEKKEMEDTIKYDKMLSVIVSIPKGDKEEKERKRGKSK